MDKDITEFLFVIVPPSLILVTQARHATISKKEKIVFVSLALLISLLLPVLTFCLMFFIYSYFDLYEVFLAGAGHALAGIFTYYVNIFFSSRVLKEYEKKDEFFARKVIKNLFLSIVIQCVISVFLEPPNNWAMVF